MISARQLRKLDRRIKNEVVGKMRRDLLYLLKPRPKFLPRFLWLAILKRVLNLDFNNLSQIK